MSSATDAALASVQNYKQLNSQDAINQSNAQYGVDASNARLSALKGVVGNLTSSLEAVDPSVTGRTSGTFTTEGQRQALVSKEQAPIASNLNKANANYGDEQNALTQKQALSSQMASALLSDDTKAYQRLLDQYNAYSAKDQADEQKRQYDTNLAETTRQFNESQKTKAASGGSATQQKSANTASLISDIQSNIADFRSRGNGWTEKTLIPQLVAAYPELDSKTIIDYVYQLRKQYE